MLNLNNFLVCLDGSKLDDHLIKYSAMMVRFFTNTKTTFIYVSKTKEDAAMRDFLLEKVEEYFDSKCDKEVLVIKGPGADQILKWKGLKSIDLILMGMKPKSESSGNSATKVVDGSRCSTMLVPATNKYEVSKVLVPLDFSDNSLRSLNSALKIKEQNDIEIYLQHVYFVPTGYHSTGKTYDEFAAIMLKNKMKEYEVFKKQNKLDESKYELILTLDEDQKPFDNIYEMAKEKDVDLIIVSSKGRTKAASLILRSTAVNLVKYDQDVPCLVVKDKNESIGFFDALLKV